MGNLRKYLNRIYPDKNFTGLDSLEKNFPKIENSLKILFKEIEKEGFFKRRSFFNFVFPLEEDFTEIRESALKKFFDLSN